MAAHPASPSLRPPDRSDPDPARATVPKGAVAGVVRPTTEATQLREQTVAMNEALILSAVRQNELMEAAEVLNAQLRLEIAARQKTAQELAEKARLLDLSSDAIMVRDQGGRILYWNHGAEELYGWSREEALGKVSHVLLQTEFSTPIAQITTELHCDNHWTGELVHTKRDGQRITVLVRKTLDRDAQGKPAAVLQNITDITERKQMENELREARTRAADHAKELEVEVVRRTAELAATNRQLEAFVYSIAHDLRAPLRAMQGFSELLVEEAGAALSATGQDYANRINKSAQFMDALMSDLLAFSRISQHRVELTAVDLQPVVDSVLLRLQKEIQEKNARVESVGPWPVVQAHVPTLTQVVFNLVNNALKFAVSGVAPLVRLRAEGKGEFVRVWVEDNGIGIAPDHQIQIFKVFTRLQGEKYQGTGIGLAIVQKGVERMGGRVGVESASGQGSRFWFELRQG
jgi:PAS domain S-box-containing protein